MTTSVTINGNTYTDPTDYQNYRYRTNFFAIISDVQIVASGVAADKVLAEAAVTAAEAAQTAAEAAETNAGAAQTASEAARDLAETYRDQAQSAAAAASKGVPFATTAGTGAAYTADFTPDLTATDANYFALDIHAANTVTNPTLAVEGGTAYTIVIGYDRRPIPVGLLDVGRNVTLAFDSVNNEYTIIGGLPLFEFNRNIDARGFVVDNQRSYDWGFTARGTVGDAEDVFVTTFRRNVRLYNVDASLEAGTITLDIKKNGTSVGGLSAVAVTTTQTETAVNDSSNAYIDFAAGDTLTYTRSSASSAEDLMVWMDIEERT